MFTDYNFGITQDSTLYISGGSLADNLSDDYQRPIQIMGKELTFKTADSDDNSRINMTQTTMLLGQKNAKFSLDNTTGSLTTTGAFTRTIGGANTETIGGGSTINITGNFSQTISGTSSIKFGTSRMTLTENANGISFTSDNYDSSGAHNTILLNRNGTGDSY